MTASRHPIGKPLLERRASAREQSSLALPLSQYASYFEAIIESSDDAIISKNLSGIVISWNRAAEEIFGYSAQEMIGRPMATLFPADRLDEEREILEKIARGEKVEHFNTVRLRKDGQEVHVSVTLSPISDHEGHIVGASKIARDVTERIQTERTIWNQANFDPLTNLPNRRLFVDRLQQELSRAERIRKHVAVMFIDLDRFKEVNDTLGHQAGDDLLRQAAHRIRACLRESDTVGRLGGDEFAVIIPDLPGTVEISQVTQRLNHVLQSVFTVLGEPVYVSGSIGVALYPEDGGDIDDLLKHADQAMYEAKRNGRNQTRYFTRALQEQAQRRMQLMSELRVALVQQQFQLLYQPIICLHDGTVQKIEALIRWHHPRLGTVSPSAFIPLAEESGLILEMGDWAFRSAIEQIKHWQQEHGPALQVSINLSPVQLRAKAGYFEAWVALLQELGIDGKSVVVEINEGMMVDQSEATERNLATLRRAGVQIAIDDFGTGYSCLAYLKRLDVNYLKIHPSFVSALGKDPKDLALCEAIVVMAHKLGLKVIAEGVETPEQRHLLGIIQCDFAQGYLMASPCAANDVPMGRLGA